MELEEFSTILEETSTAFFELSKSYCKVLEDAAGMCKSLRGVVPEDYAPGRISPDTYLLLYKVAFTAAEAGTSLIELGRLQEKKWEATKKYAKHYKAKFSHLNSVLGEGTHNIDDKLEKISKIKGAEKENSGQEEAELGKILRRLQESLDNISRETAKNIDDLLEK